ncbi:hypothetical protein Tco_0854735 [Tanacetum coccineum]
MENHMLVFAVVMSFISTLYGETKTKVGIGVILDTEASLGKMSRSCISMALGDFYKKHDNYTTRIVPHFRDSKQDNVEAASVAIALEKVASGINFSTNFKRQPESMTDVDGIGISEMGPRLILLIRNIKLNGLSGDFYLVDGQLQPSVYQIVNILDKGLKHVSYWTPTNGIRKKLHQMKGSKDDLRAIIWPGDTTFSPKGWEIPTSSESKLRVGVPARRGFAQFVDVNIDPKTRKVISVTGFCIDIFTRKIKGSNLASSVHLGVAREGWETVPGLTRGEVEKQLIEICGDCVVFVVLVLTSSYTASLTSMLTVQKLQPAYTDIDKIMRNGESVGYQASSFVYNKLKGMGFDESQLKNYSNFEQYDKALELGSQSGGVSAIVDEIPYLKVFLAKYCTKYTMTGPTYKTAGFGFAFPKGSPLVADVSRAILQVTEEVREMLVSQGSVGQKLASIAKTFDVFKDGESKTTTAEAC